MIAVYIWIVALSLAIVILMIEDDSNKREMKILRDKVDELVENGIAISHISYDSPITSPIVVYNTDGKSGYKEQSEALLRYETLVEAERAYNKFLVNSRK